MTSWTATQELTKTRRIGQFKRSTEEVEWTEDDRRKVVALYDGGIRYADTYMERLRSLLEELALWDQTLVIFLSDHGEEFWEHGNVLHSFTVFQDQVHVPLILKFPGGDHAGIRVDQPVRLLDVAPTVLGLLELPVPPSMQGGNLLPFIEGKKPLRAIVTEMHSTKAWITMPHKLITDIDDETLRLFDLSADPGEQHDLAKERPEEVRRLYGAMVRTLGDGMKVQVRGYQRPPPEDPELLEQLRALGYIE